MTSLKYCEYFSVIITIQLIITLNFVTLEKNNKHRIDLNINYIIIDSVCERNIETDKTRCVAESVSVWDSVDDREKAGCCMSWDINDCILDAVSEKCDRITYNRIKRFVDQQNKDHSKGLCKDYTYGSYKCHFPVWAIVLIVVFGVAIVGVTAFLVCMYCYQRQQTLKYF